MAIRPNYPPKFDYPETTKIHDDPYEDPYDKVKQGAMPGEVLVDPVNSPPHYKGDDIECIDAMVQQFGIDYVQVYAQINAFKYMWRCNKKGNSVEDRQKAVWYLRFSLGDDPRKD